MTATTARLDAIEAQLGTITPGPWEVDRNYPFTDDLVGIFCPGAKKYVVQVENQDDVDDPTSDEDAEFIAAAPDTIRELLTLAREQAAALERVEAEVDGELQDAEPSNYEEDNYDAGYIAGLTFAQDLLRAAIRAVWSAS